MKGSITAIHLSFASPSNSRFVSGPARRGLKPSVTRPSIFPWWARSQIESQVASPSCLPRKW